LLSQADVVVDVTTISSLIRFQETPESTTFTTVRYQLKLNATLQARISVNAVAVETVATTTARLLKDGERYILFLAKADTTGSVDGIETFELVSGMRGMFTVQNGQIFNYCPNGDDPDKPLPASGAGQGEDAASFISMIQKAPLPPKPTAATKTGTPISGAS
jgi:hypothetical protein